MGAYTQRLPDLTIASGATRSNIVSGFDDARTIFISAPVSVTNTCQLRVHASDSRTFPTLASDTAGWATLTSGGAVITLIGFTGIELTDVAWRSLQVVSQGTEAGVRTFLLNKKTTV